jgi:hypothetical protein
MSILKDSINFEIREAIRKYPKSNNQQIAEMFDDITWQKVRANRSWVTMGVDTDNQQERKPNKKSKNKTYYGTRKISARNRKVDAILKSNSLVGNILTLCGEGLVVENELFLKGAKDFIYDLVEFKRDIFNKILMAVSTSPLNIGSINNDTMNSMIHKAHTDQYAHAILDYCDSLNTNKSEVDMALENNIVRVNGVICMTFSIRKVKPIMNVDEVKGECKNLSGAKKYFSRFENYELVDSFTYRDSMPMMVLILKRLK